MAIEGLGLRKVVDAKKDHGSVRKKFLALGAHKGEGVVIDGDNHVVGGQILQLVREAVAKQRRAARIPKTLAVHVFHINDELVFGERA